MSDKQVATVIDDYYPMNQSPKSSGGTDNQGADQLNRTRLKVPLNLGTKQPAIVRLGIGRWTESAGIATFLDRSG